MSAVCTEHTFEGPDVVDVWSAEALDRMTATSARMLPGLRERSAYAADPTFTVTPTEN